MPNTALFIKTRTMPGKRGEVQRLWETHLKDRAQSNPAQEVYFFCLDDDDPDTLLLFEIYNDAAAMAENANSDWFAEYARQVGPLIQGRPEVHRATPVWQKLPE